MKFIPKLRDRGLLGTNVSEFFIDANLILEKKLLFSEAVAEIPTFVINPITNRFPFNNTKKSAELPYFFPNSQYDEILNNSSLRLSKLIIPCIDFQLEKGSSKIIPPYFCVDDVNSQVFNVNIENITNVITYKKRMTANFEIFPMINVNSYILTNDNLVRYIASMYMSKELNDHVKGYYLMIDNLDANKSDPRELIGLLNLVKALSKKEVYIIAINAFGYLPLLLGAKGMISGLASAENVNTEYWKINPEDNKKLRSRESKFTYMPEIFAYIDEIELQKMAYKCSCKYCGGSIPKTNEDKKKHFLACRERDIEKIFTGDFDENFANLKGLFTEGKKTAIQLISKYKISKPSASIISPLNKWIDLLDAVVQINKQDEAEDLLNKILEDIDNDTSNN